MNHGKKWSNISHCVNYFQKEESKQFVYLLQKEVGEGAQYNDNKKPQQVNLVND